MATNRRSANYSVDEVEALIEFRTELDPTLFKLTWLVRFWDLDVAIRKLRPKQREAVYLVGLLGLSTWTVADMLGITHQSVWERYRRGIESLVNYLNGGHVT